MRHDGFGPFHGAAEAFSSASYPKTQLTLTPIDVNLVQSGIAHHAVIADPMNRPMQRSTTVPFRRVRRDPHSGKFRGKGVRDTNARICYPMFAGERDQPSDVCRHEWAKSKSPGGQRRVVN